MALKELHSRLGQLRARRRLVRWGLSWSAFLAGALVTLAVAFLIDWALQMSRPQRFVSLLVCLGAFVWIFRKYALPWLGTHETDVDLALLVEKNQHIDSDLVAALQFSEWQSSALPSSGPQASGRGSSQLATAWGSSQLATAVIDYVEDFSTHLNVFEGFSYRRLKRRLATGGAALLVALVWTAIFPGHVRAFLNRFVLGSAHYPTHTQIARLRVNRTITLTEEAGEKAAEGAVKSPHGEPLTFEILARGEIPADGLVRLISGTSGTQVEVPLVRTGTPGEKQAVFRGELPHLVDSLTYQVYLGDAWTDPLDVNAIPTPVVTVELTPHPPAYAASQAAGESHAGTRQIAVIEGSSVDLKVICGNKRLKSATLTIPELAAREAPRAAATNGGRATSAPAANATPATNAAPAPSTERQAGDEGTAPASQPGSAPVPGDEPSGKSPAADSTKTGLDSERPTATPAPADPAKGDAVKDDPAKSDPEKPDSAKSDPANEEYPPIVPVAPPVVPEGDAAIPAPPATPAPPARTTWPLVATSDPAVWTLSVKGTPFEEIRQPLRYEIQVEDEDGMTLDRPLLGYIRLKADRIPRVAAAIVSRKVVPAATPRIVYGAADDFGIARIVAKIQVSRKDGTVEDSVRQVVAAGKRGTQAGSNAPKTVVRGEYSLDLSTLQLEKGDELKVTLEAFDYRGDKEPKSSVSEPLVLSVTDREGILAGLQEADEKSAKQLDAIIQRELGIGESK